MKYVSFEDIHVYSIDEVFIDATDYVRTRGMTAHDFARMMIQDVLETTGITATAGIGSNLYLAKIAMDIYAKHVPADRDGVRIAELDEMSYRRILWNHRPMTDFWRVGKGIARKLEANGMFTMGDVARVSVSAGGEDRLHRLFGVNAELLIDHAWGWEPCTIADIKNFKAETKSISAGQVLSEPYSFDKAKMIIREMTDGLVLDLVKKKLLCDQIVVTIGYDTAGASGYAGELEEDRYGRKTPKQAHGSINRGKTSSSTKLIMSKTMELYDRIVNPELPIRRMYVVANHISEEKEASFEQMDLFSLLDDEEKASRKKSEEKEKRLQQAVLAIKSKHGKNAILSGTSYQDGATGRDRNQLIGGHRQ
ncbi:MAG: DNA methylase [Oscillospiraceae bacterium]|nr:DNA methylase [Oscillospiraceae bacterium]